MPIRSLCVLALLCFLQAAYSQSDPWVSIQPAQLAKVAGTPAAPVILMVGPRILFNGNHIQGAVYAGPAGKPEGLDNLVKAAATMAKTQPIVIYCGCCPMEKCPNIRPAFAKLKDLGYQNIKVLIIPTNLHDDWTAQGYPVEKGDISR